MKNEAPFLRSEIGGKAYNLRILEKRNFSVPKFYTISSNMINDWLNSLGIDKNRLNLLLDKKDKNLALRELKNIREIINKAEFGENIKKRIFEVFYKFPDQRLIIRSSSSSEDGVKDSFAGMYESKILDDRKKIEKMIKEIIASSFSLKVYSYLKIKEIKIFPSISIIIQEYIDGEVSGVLFTKIIKNGRTGTLINSNLGGASSVVGGSNCDSFFLNSGNLVFEDIINKTPSLSEKQIKLLFNAGKKIEEVFSNPQDIEWSIKNSKVYILQSRPITADFTKELRVWDNSNIAESYSGIVLPLTASYIRYAYKETFSDLARRSGIREKNIREYENIFENLLGFFYGRVYYNMFNWYKMLTLYPGYKRNKKNFDYIISAKSKTDLEEEYKKNVSIMFKLKYYSILAFRYPFFNKEVDKFKAHVNTYNYNFYKINLEKMSSQELLDLYYKSVNELLKKWSITVENDFLLMIFYGKLREYCEKNNIDSNEFLDLISNIQNVVSAQQVSILKEISEEFSKNKELMLLAGKNNHRLCLEKINTEPKYTKLKKQIENYLNKYGGRFANELKLESPDLYSNPEYLIKLIFAYSKSEISNINQNINNKKSFRVNYLTNKIRYYTKRREELRLLRAQSFGVARRLFKEIGHKLKDQGIINEWQDIFYMEVDEIKRQIEGSIITSNLKEIIKLRKKQYQDFKKIELEDVFITEGDPYSSLPIHTVKKYKRNLLKGEGCSKGIIKGKIKILDKFYIPENENFEIIVTKNTDPGWTPIFGLCKGLIVENGGMLSHAAIISREINLPCVIGIKNATSILRDGQIVTINGFTGEVKIHE